jgi:hypothetical protein
MSCAPFTLTLIFHGLIAFVMPTAKHQEVWAVLVNATDIRTVPAPFVDPNQCIKNLGGSCTVKDDDAFLHPHRSAIRYKSKNAVAHGGDSVRLWLLDGEDIAIDAAENGGGVAFASGRRANSNSPDLKDRAQVEDFSWVPKLQEVSRRLGKVHPEVVSQSPNEDLRDRISARLKLTGGKLSTGSVGINIKQTGEKEPRIFNFFPGIEGARVRQALADSVVYQTVVGGCEVKIVGTRFGDGINRKELVLRPSDGESEVEVEIVNVRDEFLIGDDEEANHVADHGGENFLWFYKLSSNNMGPFPIPVPDGQVNGKPYCPLVSLEGEY